MTRLIKFIPGEYFHVYNRGTNKIEIFLDDYDSSRFQKLLYLNNSRETLQFSDLNNQNLSPVWEIKRGETLVDIGAYTLMPNHFHILLRSKNEKDTALFLQRILGSHSKYFNSKRDRTGSLFQGKSKAEHIKGDVYLRYMYTYIHLNPLKLIQSDWREVGLKNIYEAKEYLKNYTYSSYVDYLGIDRSEGKILAREAFPDYFKRLGSFEAEISEFLHYGKS